MAAQGSRASPVGSGQSGSAERGGSHQRSMAAHELGAVGGDRSGSPVDVGESHAAAEVGAEGVVRQESAGLGVDLGDDVHRGRRRGSGPGPTRHSMSPTAVAGRSLAFWIRSRISLIGSSGGTRRVSSWGRPCVFRSKMV